MATIANMTGSGSWTEAFLKAKELVGQMTLAEKVCDFVLLPPPLPLFFLTNRQVNLTGGVSSNTSCNGFLPAVPRLGFPGMCLSDAGNGLRGTDFVSSWPSGIHVGASWNKALARRRGTGMGGEFRTKGVNVLLGPVVGPAGRVVLSGRNWEGEAGLRVCRGDMLADASRFLERPLFIRGSSL
jgi:beta-glucosidase